MQPALENRGNRPVVEVPAVFFRCLAIQGEPLGISHNLRRIQGRSQIFGKFRFVDNGDGRCRNDLLSRFTSRIVGRYARIASCRNHGNIDAQLQGFQARPAPRTLLACRINDFIDNIAVRQVVFFRKNIGGNTDEETLQFPLIPSMEGFGNFPIRKLRLRIS